MPIESHKNGQTQQLKTTYLFKLLSNVFSLWYAHGRTLHCTAALWSLCCVNGSTNKKKKKSLLTTGVHVCVVCLFCSLSGCPLAAMGKLISQAQQKKSGEWETVLCLHALSSVQLDCPFIYLCGSCDGSPCLFQFCVVSAVGDCVYTCERQLHNVFVRTPLWAHLHTCLHPSWFWSMRGELFWFFRRKCRWKMVEAVWVSFLLLGVFLF